MYFMLENNIHYSFFPPASSLESFSSSTCVNLRIIDWKFLSHPHISTYRIREEFFSNPYRCDFLTINANSLANYWTGREKMKGDYFIVDLGCCVSIRKAILKNSYNAIANGASGHGER